MSQKFLNRLVHCSLGKPLMKNLVTLMVLVNLKMDRMLKVVLSTKIRTTTIRATWQCQHHTNMNIPSSEMSLRICVLSESHNDKVEHCHRNGMVH